MKTTQTTPTSASALLVTSDKAALRRLVFQTRVKTGAPVSAIQTLKTTESPADASASPVLPAMTVETTFARTWRV